MSEYPLVSCLMPTKNRRAFIPRAIRMWEQQDWPNKELIVVWDGENVGDLMPPDEVREPDVVMRCVYFEGTLGAKLNYGAQIARGSILLNYDDDDWNAPDRISMQIRHMQLSGKPFVGFSSLIYYAEGDTYGWNYSGPSSYASGSTHCYTREWALAHPRPDKTVGEDNVAVAEAHRLGALSTISGTQCLVACDHSQNCSPRGYADDDARWLREHSDEFKHGKIPLSAFAATIHSGDAEAV